MKKFVVDASIAVKWFVPEIHSIAAARFLGEGIYLSAPDLIASEVGNTIWKKVRRQELTRDEASEILAAFETVGIEFHPLLALLPSAFQLAVALDRTVYDSMYLALAVALDAPLVTADEKFFTAVRNSALASQIRWIEDEL